MRRRRKSREVLGVSLFPFLAVLICTLGVLIVLLVLAVKAADVEAADAKTAVEAEVQHSLDELDFQIELKTAQIEGLEQLRPEVSKRLADARSHRGYLEEEVRELKRKAQQLGEQLLALEKSQPETIDLASTQEQIAKLETQLATAKSALRQKRSEAKTAGPVTFSIVPHHGHGGTFRRPIFVECTADALILQPLGITLAKQDFQPPLQPGNMLDSALLAIREYWNRYDLSGEDGSPYPLLVVRPEGAETYALARHAMQSWDDEFGYELVEADKLLDFGRQDPQLVDKVKQAIADARKRQQFIANQRRLIQFRSGNQFAGGNSQGSMGSNGGGFDDGEESGHGTPVGLTASSPLGGFAANSDWKKSAAALAREINDERSSKQGSEVGERGGTNEFSAQADPNQTVGTPRGSTGSRSSDSAAKSGGDKSGSGKTGSGSGASGSSSESSSNSSFGASSLANQRGSNWALPSQTPGATGYVRPIRVVCGSDELEIRSSVGLEKRIAIDGNIISSVDPLVNEIWKQIESWGISGSRSFWIPELRISVLPGGELNFERLKALLADSGIVVKESGQ